MNLKKGVNGIVIDEENFKVVIANNGNMKELWFAGTFKDLRKALGSKTFEEDNLDFAEKLVDELNSIK